MDNLFPYQVDGIEWLSTKNYAMLCDEMGLGKTIQAIRGLDRIHAKVVLVVCPSVARINWLREFEMWSRFKREYQILSSLSDTPQPGHTCICSFDYLSQNYLTLKSQAWDAVVIDEGHFIKSPKALRTKAAFGKEGIIRATKRCWLLSGTPAPNHAGELWVPLYTFGVTDLSYDAFIKKYCLTRHTPHGLQITGTRRESIPDLQQLLKKIMLRRMKKDVMAQLPPITFRHKLVEPGRVKIEDMASFIQYFTPTDRSGELKEKLQKEAETLRVLMDGTDPDFKSHLQMIHAVQKSVSTIRRFIGLQKVEPTVETIKYILKRKDAEKVVLFAVHRDVIEELRIGLRDFGPVVLYGQTDPITRQKHIDRFQSNPKCRVFIGNILAAGTAITLTAAHHVYFVEQDWVPGNNAQAVMRVHRIGQTHPVSVTFILIDKSLDARIGYVLKRKTEELTEIFDFNN